MAYMKFTIKIIVFWLNQRKFNKTLEMMTEDWDNCADNEIYMHEMISKAKWSNRINNVIVILHIASAVTYSLRTILADVDVTDSTSKLPYVHKIEFPFDVNTKRTYKIILLTETVICTMNSMGTGAINALLLILSKAIGNAAYNSAWYNLKPEDSRILSFIILRSQKQLTLTVGKIADLSLEYFTSIMNASGSYLSVMLAMQ
ncbi:PREDICTED: uncharacterized protein LOC108778735 [Cyphomyrmex costatus]|uniref:uncharacterized protein LOC108778735 n=1 Tax=Cyphomyrmex costatus TaxID=456900 RepID=UPI0008523171|nr:PREDICTED: uncharacterized protein LOC108778735 [Cyphomyrmex costatus]